MSLFSHKHPENEGGVIIDIGSGSVGVGIVATTEGEPAKILWSYREYILKKSTTEAAALMREITTALINALLELGSQGLSSGAYTESGSSINRVQVTLCAPWSHTATKSITFKKEEPFLVTKSFIKELIKASKKEIADQTQALTELGFEVISESVVEILLNEYAVENPIDSNATTINLSVMTAAVQSKLIEIVHSSCDKILPNIPIELYSFMSVLHKTLQYLKPNTSEICIIDVTDEATEIGFVRDDVLRYATHRPNGLRTVAHALAKTLDITEEEGRSMLRRSHEEIIGSYKAKEVALIEAVLAAYEADLALLFNDSNDELSIPEALFLHTDHKTETFFTNRILATVATLSKNKKVVHLVNEQLLEGVVTEDSALAVCAYHYFEKDTFRHADHSLL